MEAEFIHWLRRRLPPHPQLLLGPGDDAAVLRLAADAACVVTTDTLTDGVDFILGRDDPRRIGRKALAVNLSDLAAMAARPVAALVSLVLPRANAEIPALDLAVELFEGLLPLAEAFHIAIAGGDTNTWPGSLVIGVTVIGETTARGPLRRGGARLGDVILVTGQFGGSILGKQFDFVPRAAEALLLNERYSIHAATDVSDGLSLDLSHICAESQCGAVVELSRIPVSTAATELARQLGDGRSPLDHALADGEDFELILAVPPDEADRLLAEQPLQVPLSRIGTFTAEPGLWQIAADGSRSPMTPRGYQH
jgi:thiamine-monophosphate kinase